MTVQQTRFGAKVPNNQTKPLSGKTRVSSGSPVLAQSSDTVYFSGQQDPVTKAYRMAIRLVHPDKSSDSSPEEFEQRTKDTKALNAARKMRDIDAINKIIEKYTPLEYEPMAGESIHHAAEQATKLSHEKGRSATMKFNEITLTINPDSKPNDVVAAYHEESDRQAEAYRNSPAGKQAAAEAEARLIAAQMKADQLIADLPKVMAQGETAIIPFLAEFADAADHIGVRANMAAVREALLAKGYKENDALGLPQEEYNKPDVLARYFIGQFLNFPHPNYMHIFAEKYVELIKGIKSLPSP